MKKDSKSKIVITIFIAVAVITIVALWIVPDTNRVYAEYKGDGAAYSADKEKDTEKASGSGDSISQDIITNEDEKSFKSDLDEMLNNSKKLKQSMEKDRVKEVKTPNWVLNLNRNLTQKERQLESILMYLLMGLAGFWYIHSVLAIVFDGYFDYFSSKKFSGFSKHLLDVKSSGGGVSAPKAASSTDYGSYGATDAKPASTSKPTAVKSIFGQIGSFTLSHILLITVLVVILMALQSGLLLNIIIWLGTLLLKGFNWVINTVTSF